MIRPMRPLVALSLLAAACAVALPAHAQPAQAAAAAPSPKRINRAIELLEQGQPVYYAQISGGGYDEGRRMAATKADYITYDMEHGSLDFSALRAFMRGLVDAGPTRTGHRTPTVIVTLPIAGSDAASLKANVWMVQQTLAAGVHGILLCQAEAPDAVKVFVEATRYPFAPEAAGLEAGKRGAGSQGFAAQIWGVTQNEYLRRADAWPLNPDGEIMLGIKIENPRATARAEELTRVPGLTFAEWGPSDQAFYLIGRPTGQGGDIARHPAMAATRARVLAATKAAKIRFLNACNEADVVDQLKDGVMICTGGDTPAADKGRAYTRRPQPW